MAKEKGKSKRKRIEEVIAIPKDIEVDIMGREIKMIKEGREIKRKLSYDVRKENDKILLGCKRATKRDKKLIKTNAAHIRNMISGLEEKFVYKLQICSVHFPMSVSVSDNEVVIKNFLGETKPRKVKILENVNVKVENDIITVESSDKEKAGQAAANIEMATRIRRKDKRIFQDGIWLITKSKGARRKNG